MYRGGVGKRVRRERGGSRKDTPLGPADCPAQIEGQGQDQVAKGTASFTALV